MVNQTNNSDLLIDIGNSSLKWCIVDPKGLSAMSQQLYPKNITVEFFIANWRTLDKPDGIFVSCVAQDAVWQALEKACFELWNIKVEKVNSLKTQFGLSNAYKNASSLGSDRWCAMLGGLQQSDSAFIVINAGSALTVDVVNEEGQHLGGYIVPGVNMMKKSLDRHTAQVQVDSTSNVLTDLSFGRSTEDCVESGIHFLVVKYIEAIYEKVSLELNGCKVFVSGGDAKSIAALLSFNSDIVPDLVLRGLAAIATNKFK